MENNEIVREFIITDSLRKIVAKNIEDISASTHLFRRLFAEATRIMLSEVDADIYALRRELSRRKLRIVGEESTQGTKGNALIVRYTVRQGNGVNKERTELQREDLRREIGLRLSKRMKAMEERASKAESKAEEKAETNAESKSPAVRTPSE